MSKQYDLNAWAEIYRGLGYETEFNMLHDLYIEQKMTIREISRLLGKSGPTIRIHLAQASIPLRARGGPNHKGSGDHNHPVPLSAIPSDELKNALKAALKYKYSLSSIFSERRRRKEKEPHGDTSGPDPQV